jgi:hypothetical protein
MALATGPSNTAEFTEGKSASVDALTGCKLDSAASPQPANVAAAKTDKTNSCFMAVPFPFNGSAKL